MPASVERSMKLAVCPSAGECLLRISIIFPSSLHGGGAAEATGGKGSGSARPGPSSDEGFLAHHGSAGQVFRPFVQAEEEGGR